jgi:aspartyl protease family protein
MVRFLVIGFFAALCAVGMAQRLTGFSEAGTPHAATATTPAAPQSDSTDITPGEASIAKSADGHFWADAEVDGHPVHFLIDTGATEVALTQDDARTLGIDPGSLIYNGTVVTAAGPARAARVKLGVISVGRAEVADVEAIVIDHGLQTSLLGMTYLGRLTKFEATQNTMDLKS